MDRASGLDVVGPGITTYARSAQDHQDRSQPWYSATGGA
jgi:hypothetical protein